MENNNVKTENTLPSVKIPYYKRMTKPALITALIAFPIIGILIITTIILAVVPVYAGARYETKPDYMVIEYNNTQMTVYNNDTKYQDAFNRIWNAYNDASSPTVMDSIFNGYAGQGMTANYSSSPLTFSSLANETTFAVTFYWNDSQLMTNKDGSQFNYTLQNGSEVTTGVRYISASFSVDATNSVVEKTFYLRRDTQTATSTNTHYYYTGIANYYGLYLVLMDLQAQSGNFAPTS